MNFAYFSWSDGNKKGEMIEKEKSGVDTPPKSEEFDSKAEETFWIVRYLKTNYKGIPELKTDCVKACVQSKDFRKRRQGQSLEEKWKADEKS